MLESLPGEPCEFLASRERVLGRRSGRKLGSQARERNELLKDMIERRWLTVSREALFEEIWDVEGELEVTTRIVDSHVSCPRGGRPRPWPSPR